MKSSLTATNVSPTIASVKHIVIVDDNPTVTSALADILRAHGFKPVTFNTGLEALAYVQDHPPDAAVLDIHLPDVNGLVLSRQLRDRLGGTFPIVILSGDTSIETLKALNDVGATYFFNKPVNTHTLIEHLKQLL